MLKSIPPTNESEAMILIEENIMMKYPDFSIDSTSYNKDYTSCKILYKVSQSTGKAQEEHVVNIKYQYDENVKKSIDTYVAKLPVTGQNFQVKDMEIVNFWVNAKGNDLYLINYSEDFKNIMKKMVDYTSYTEQNMIK